MSNMYPPPPPNQPNQPPPNDSGYPYGYPPPPNQPPAPDGYSYPQQPVWGGGGPAQPPPGPPRRGGMSAAVIVVIIVVVLGAVIGGLAFFASKNKDDNSASVADPMASAPSTQTTAPEQIPATTDALPDPDSTPSSDLGSDDGSQDITLTVVGNCLNDPAGQYTADVDVVSCTSPHAREVFAAGRLDAAATYDKKNVVTRTEKYCKDKFKTYVGVSFDDSKLDVDYIYPLKGNWDLGERSVTCLVSDPRHSKTSGSARGSRV